MEDLELLIAVGVGCLVIAIFGAWVASQKGRSVIEGLILGFLFNLLGVLIEALLPSGNHPSPSKQVGKNEPDMAAYLRKMERVGEDWSS